MTGERVDLEATFEPRIAELRAVLMSQRGSNSPMRLPHSSYEGVNLEYLAPVMLDYIDTLRAQVAALAVVTDEMVDMALSAYNDNVYRSVEKGMRAALATVLGVAATEQRCKTCRHARVDGADMECESMSRVQFMGPPPNGTAYATPYEGCSAVLEVTPDFGCVLWEARKDGV